MKCYFCKEDNACIKCCDKYICLFHYYCTIHWTHPSNAVIIDEKIYKQYKPELAEYVDRIRNDLVIELIECEKKPEYDEDSYDATQRTETVPENLWMLSTTKNEDDREINNENQPPPPSQSPPPPPSSNPPPKKRAKVEKSPVTQNTSQDVRENIRNKLFASLKNRITPDDGNISVGDIIERIKRIEEGLFNKYKSSDNDNYRRFYRSLKMQIDNKSNTTFYKIIINNEIDVNKIVNMNNEDMLDIKDKQTLKQIGEKFLPIVKEQVNKTKKVTCMKCGNNDCSYVYIKAPKDIPKGETWGSKDTPDAIIKFTCQVCSNSWNVENDIF